MHRDLIWKLDIQHHQLPTSDTDKLQTRTLDHIEGNNLFTNLLLPPEIISPHCGLQEASSTAATLDLNSRVSQDRYRALTAELQRITHCGEPAYPTPQLQGS